ncbi:MAG: hypothetical protein PUP93_19780 [Rhizonema sp. NSF051]|nr:hypothetical protein [Rhizonema sp. NSF051]
MSKIFKFIQPFFKPWHALTVFMVVSVIVLGSGIGEFFQTSFLSSQPAMAQASSSEAAQRVYQQLPDLPRENKYISKETGKVSENNTLINRLIRYHVYLKGRATNYRLDWKLTLADYLGANEIIYDSSYPGNDILRQNPIDSDRSAIGRLNRRQRDALVQALVNVFNPNQNTPASTPNPSSQLPEDNFTRPQLPKPGDAQKLK